MSSFSKPSAHHGSPEGQGLLFSCRKVSQVTSHPSTFEDCFEKNLMELTPTLCSCYLVSLYKSCVYIIYIQHIFAMVFYHHQININIYQDISRLWWWSPTIIIIIIIIIITTSTYELLSPNLGLLSIQLRFETASEISIRFEIWKVSGTPKWKVDSPQWKNRHFVGCFWCISYDLWFVCSGDTNDMTAITDFGYLNIWYSIISISLQNTHTYID